MKWGNFMKTWQNISLLTAEFGTCRGVGIDATVLLFLALLALEGEEVDSSK
jgi:hypothetical protein